MCTKVYFISLGCSRNLVDSEIMIGLLSKNDCLIVTDLKKADCIVINTCGFLESARKESEDTISEILVGKKKDARVVVAGCMVPTNLLNLKKKFPNVDYFLGSGDLEGIVEAVCSKIKGEKTCCKSYLQDKDSPRTISTQGYAYIKIAEGCSKCCSYCIIPKIKGPLKSRDSQDIIDECKKIISSGCKELIFTAQDLGDFGKDRGEEDGLVNLLKNVCDLEGDFGIRLLYVYPDEIDDKLLQLMKERKDKIYPYLDMPIQHIHDEILQKMRRKTSSSQIKSIINRARELIPDIVIRTSLIVGFPGEREEHFKALLDFLKEYQLDNVGIFTYSNEKGSIAFEMPDQVDKKVSLERFERLAKIQSKITDKKNKKYIGQKLKVLIEGFHPESKLLAVGRFYAQAPEVDGVVIINDIRQINKFGSEYLVEITDSIGCDLVGLCTK